MDEGLSVVLPWKTRLDLSSKTRLTVHPRASGVDQIEGWWGGDDVKADHGPL